MDYKEVRALSDRLDREVKATDGDFLLWDLPAQTVGELAEAIDEAKCDCEDAANAACEEYSKTGRWPPLEPLVRAVVRERLIAAQEALDLFLVPVSETEPAGPEGLVAGIHPEASTATVLRWLLVALPFFGLRGRNDRLIARIHGLAIQNALNDNQRLDRN